MAVHKSRNSTLPGGVPKLSRSAVYKKRALYKRKKVQTKPSVEPVATHKTKQVQGEKNGGSREVPLKRQVSYLATNVLTPVLIVHFYQASLFQVILFNLASDLV